MDIQEMMHRLLAKMEANQANADAHQAKMEANMGPMQAELKGPSKT
jgi:hypothetical protein